MRNEFFLENFLQSNIARQAQGNWLAWMKLYLGVVFLTKYVL